MNTHVSRKKMKKKEDEWYTPSYIWDMIKDYIEPFKDKVIYEGFYGCGKTYEYFKENGYNILGEKGLDFFDEKSNDYIDNSDIIISNPPFSIKYKIINTLVNKDKSFILILPLSCINTISFRKAFNGNMDDLTLLIPRGRLKFLKGNDLKSSPSFESCFVCYKISQEKIVFI